MASLSQGRTAAAQCGLFTYKSVPVIFEPPCKLVVSVTLKRVTVKLEMSVTEFCNSSNGPEVRAL